MEFDSGGRRGRGIRSADSSTAAACSDRLRGRPGSGLRGLSDRHGYLGDQMKRTVFWTLVSLWWFCALATFVWGCAALMEDACSPDALRTSRGAAVAAAVAAGECENHWADLDACPAVQRALSAHAGAVLVCSVR